MLTDVDKRYLNNLIGKEEIFLFYGYSIQTMNRCSHQPILIFDNENILKPPVSYPGYFNQLFGKSISDQYPLYEWLKLCDMYRGHLNKTFDLSSNGYIIRGKGTVEGLIPEQLTIQSKSGTIIVHITTMLGDNFPPNTTNLDKDGVYVKRDKDDITIVNIIKDQYIHDSLQKLLRWLSNTDPNELFKYMLYSKKTNDTVLLNDIIKAKDNLQEEFDVIQDEMLSLSKQINELQVEFDKKKNAKTKTTEQIVLYERIIEKFGKV